MAAEILETIVASRRRRIREEGADQGLSDQFLRGEGNGSIGAGTVPFVRTPLVICEVKRRSPSRGDISRELDPADQAGHYHTSGVGSVSVLTEQDHFGGSLADLINVKRTHPQLAVLRKDFLLTPEDIDVSYRAGADAVLLIAAILEPKRLGELYKRTLELGMTALVEVHDSRELNKVKQSGIRPALMGINARNLRNFQVDMLGALKLRQEIDWKCDVVFESGIFAPAQAAHAAASGFSGVLVGEAAVKIPELPASLSHGLENPVDFPQAGHEFWGRLLGLRRGAWLSAGTGGKREGRPLVKVCGITRRTDAEHAAAAGADLLGFVFADSPRKASLALLEELRDLDVLKVAVVTGDPDEKLREAWRRGLIDVFQYHGDERPEDCQERRLPFYKALSLRTEAQVDDIMSYASPRVLVDAYSSKARGGTGMSIEADLVTRAAVQKPLWLAGGLNPENIFSKLESFSPELVDVSSGLESAPGEKDHEKVMRFFQEIQRAGI